MWRRSRSREEGQGLTEFLGLVLIVATCLALGASLLPSTELPGLARNGYRDAVCKTFPVSSCDDREDVAGTSHEDDNGGDDGTTDDGNTEDGDEGDDGTTQPTEDEDDGGDDGGGFLDGVGDFFSGAGDVISDGASALWEGTKQVGGVFKGIGEGFVDTVTGLWDTITNPAETWEGIKQLFTDPVGSLGAIWDGIKDPIVDDWNNGNYGEAIGRGIFSIAEVVFGGKGLTKLGKVGKVDTDKPNTDKPDDNGNNNDDDNGNNDDDQSGDEETTACPRSWRGGSGPVRIDLYGTTKEDGDCTPQGTGSLSDEAKETYDYVDEHNGQPPSGYKKHGYENDPDKYAKPGQPKAEKLPDATDDGTAITYSTVYTNKKVPGQDTNGERLVYGSDGSVWYTTDHYENFTRVE